MRHHWKKAAAVGFLVFLGLWIGGAIYGLTLPYPQPAVWHLASEDSAQLSRLALSNQYAANNLKQIGLAKTPLPLVLDQADVERIRVYDKTAQLTLGSTAFDDDETRIRSALEAFQAGIFTEKNGGIAPERRLTLEIGVHPDKFDALVDKLREIGHLESVSVQQQERTGEFRRLHAQRQSLKKHLEAVLKLRGTKNLSIDDTLKLEQRIQDIEKELLTLSGQLGDLLGKESFYHVHLTLFEYQPGGRLDRAYTVPQRLFRAFLWALTRWFAVAVAAGVLAGTWISVQTLWPRAAVSA